MWTALIDNHPHSKKLNPALVFIEAPAEQARVIFYGRTKVNPNKQSCFCCEQDYDADEYDTLEQATARLRGCVYNEDTGEYEERFSWGGIGRYQTIEEFVLRDDVLVIHSEEIEPDETMVELPEDVASFDEFGDEDSDYRFDEEDSDEEEYDGYEV